MVRDADGDRASVDEVLAAARLQAKAETTLANENVILTCKEGIYAYKQEAKRIQRVCDRIGRQDTLTTVQDVGAPIGSGSGDVAFARAFSGIVELTPEYFKTAITNELEKIIFGYKDFDPVEDV